MPQDSLHIIPDTLAILNPDSLSVIDTPQILVDTLPKADIISVSVLRGFEGIELPSSPSSESWVFVLVVFMFMLLVITFSRSMGWFAEALENMFKVKERSSIFSKSGSHSGETKLFMSAFSVGILSLYAYFLLYIPADGFRFVVYAKLFVVTALFFGLKYLIGSVLGYVFSDTGTSKMAKEGYFNVLSFTTIALFPVLLIQIYYPQSDSSFWQFLVLFVWLLGGLTLAIKLFQIFYGKMLDSFYIMLYLCTLEILPLFVMYGVFQVII